jgi:hypothetical protein
MSDNVDLVGLLDRAESKTIRKPEKISVLEELVIATMPVDMILPIRT